MHSFEPVKRNITYKLNTCDVKTLLDGSYSMSNIVPFTVRIHESFNVPSQFFLCVFVFQLPLQASMVSKLRLYKQMSAPFQLHSVSQTGTAQSQLF